MVEVRGVRVSECVSVCIQRRRGRELRLQVDELDRLFRICAPKGNAHRPQHDVGRCEGIVRVKPSDTTRDTIDRQPYCIFASSYIAACEIVDTIEPDRDETRVRLRISG